MLIFQSTHVLCSHFRRVWRKIDNVKTIYDFGRFRSCEAGTDQFAYSGAERQGSSAGVVPHQIKDLIIEINSRSHTRYDVT
jgi:hypothetical protein